jgi:YidC/Oxa1 family membrane protein insertase
MTKPLPKAIKQPIDRDLDWVAVKNKFFVQILAPVDGAAGCNLIAHRQPSEREVLSDSRTWDGVAVLSGVAADARLGERALAPGDSYRQAFSYYVGPKELSSIKPLGRHMKEVMDFGTLKWLCEVLVWSLKGLHAVIPNYGIAIILLTLIVRIVFWPLTHKGTESMKRMQELQPKLKELQAKYRDKPQKLQQETMAMYRENKVNPLGGCLPMLIQIPVFFALFNVLRSAIELRFAGFLWVADLSAPENLFAGMLPFGLALNILPLIMAATQAWQQHLTPTAGDPAQQKMMMFMPLIMLTFLYSMPSALVLYWTANQVLMIIQLLWQKRAKKA